MDILQDLDPNEVYREDYEEDVIQNQGLKPSGYNDNYNNQYQTQTPYYNYQEDYFNEEDEYKYLEEEQEAANLEHQKQQLHGDPHHQQYQQEVDYFMSFFHYFQLFTR